MRKSDLFASGSHIAYGLNIGEIKRGEEHMNELIARAEGRVSDNEVTFKRLSGNRDFPLEFSQK